MKASALFALCALALVACGGSSTGGGGGSATVNGKVGGQVVATTDAIGIVGTQSATTGGVTVSVAYAGVVITNVANTCGTLQGHHNPANTTALALSAYVLQGTTVPPGTYAVSATATTGAARGDYTTTDATCNGTDLHGSSGSLTLTTVSSTTIQGSYDVTLSDGDHLTGTFTAPVCAYDASTKSTGVACGS